MKTQAISQPDIPDLMSQVANCFTPEIAEKILSLKADAKMEARIQDFGQRHNEGTLSFDEREEYAEIVRNIRLLTLLKSKARQMLANAASQA